MTHTSAELKDMKFRGPVRFMAGRKGMAQQDFECISEPRFGYSWRRESRQDRGRQFYTVDGREVADLDEASRLLALPPAADNPDEQRKRLIDEFRASPDLAGRATRALSEAQCNAAVGPFGSVRAWMQRVSHSWHVGINAHADAERKAGQGFEDYRWLYTAKSAAHEVYRLMYLFDADRKTDTGLTCDFGKRCRDCPILAQIQTDMERARDNPKFPRDIDDQDIDAAKAWTCVAHILSAGRHPIDGVFVATEIDREDARDLAL